jgi:hypothetical protein
MVDKTRVGPQMPNAPDLSQPTAADIMEREARVQREADARQGRRADMRIARDGGIEESRGDRNSRSFTAEDWERAEMTTDPERRRQIRELFQNRTLPNLPMRQGWHRCWVSTTNQNDTPQARTRLGYTFCRPEQLKSEGWDADEYAVKDAANMWSGCTMWREMIAMEIPEDDFLAIMRELHHDMPYEQARGIYDSLDAAGEEIRDRGGRTVVSEGMKKMRQFTRPPRQFET